MVPKKGFSGLVSRLAGEDLFLNNVQKNILSQLAKLKNGRTHTFLSNNAQNQDGISQNMGNERCYTWHNTIIDCREIPKVLMAQGLGDFTQRLEQQAGFQNFQKMLAERSGGYLKASIFLKVVNGQQNKRYNIRLDSKSKFEEFDIIRTGLCIKTQSPEDFKMGLYHLLNWEKRNHPDYRGIFVMPEGTTA